MSAKLSELEQKAQSLGCYNAALDKQIKDGSKRLTRDHLIAAIAEFHMRDTDSAGLRWYMANMESPMLANRENYFKPEVIKAMLDNPEVYADDKIDGMRLIVHYNSVEGFTFFSRHRTESTQLPVEYTGQIAQLLSARFQGVDQFVLDCEATSLNLVDYTTGAPTPRLQAIVSLFNASPDLSLQRQREYDNPIRLVVFDCLAYDTVSIMDKPLSERRPLAESLTAALNAQHPNTFTHVGYTLEGKREYIQEIMDRGDEGVILKHKDSVYLPVQSRGGLSVNTWIKIKRDVVDSQGKDTIDCFITGFELGKKGGRLERLVATVHLSVIIEETDAVQHIASVSNFFDEERQAMTLTTADGVAVLNPKYNYRVYAVRAQDFSNQSKRLVHARQIAMRLDKSPQECRISQRLIDENIM